MASHLKGPRLHLRLRKDGPSVWEIRDNNAIRVSTRTADRTEAEKRFVEYLVAKGRPDEGPAAADEISISLCLTYYGKEHGMHVAAPATIGYAIEALGAFWKNSPVSSISRKTCRDYVAQRMTRFGKPASPGTTRRELGVLQAALNYCFQSGYIQSAPKVHLPSNPPPRERWLTRQEAAWLLRGARALRAQGSHLSDFILCGLYTGSRKTTILSLKLGRPHKGGGFVDLRQGVLYRKPPDKVATKKRQNPARLPPKYLQHLRRQAANGRTFVVEDIRGNMVSDVKNSWKGAIEQGMALAAKKDIFVDLTDVTPHTLKHTAITWALQKGATPWDAAGFFSTSLRTIEEVYGHHSPDHQWSAVDALNGRS